MIALVLLDALIHQSFYQGFLGPRYVEPFQILRERSQGYTVILQALRRVPRQELRVALVGDSTMLGLEAGDRESFAYYLRSSLRAARAPSFEVADLSRVGLLASDAMLLVDKLIASDADVVVYGVELRAFPRQPSTRWVTGLQSMLDVGDLQRLVSIGGSGWMRSELSAEDVLSGLVSSQWLLYQNREYLRRFLGYQLKGVPALQGIADWLDPAKGKLPPLGRPPRTRKFDWERSDYGMPNQNTAALQLMARLCATYLPGRCVFFLGPINPFRRDLLAEPGLYDEYRSFVTDVAEEYGLRWVDLTDALEAKDFKPPRFGATRDPIHYNSAGRKKVAALLVESTLPALEDALAQRRYAGQP